MLNTEKGYYRDYPAYFFVENNNKLASVTLNDTLKTGDYNWTECKVTATPKNGTAIAAVSLPTKVMVPKIEFQEKYALINGDLYKIDENRSLNKFYFSKKISNFYDPFILFVDGTLSILDKENHTIDLPFPLADIKTYENTASAILTNGDIYYIKQDINFNYSAIKIYLNFKVKKLFSLSDDYYAVLENGEVYAWGLNIKVNMNDNTTTPKLINSYKNMTDIYNPQFGGSVDGKSIIAINEQGELFASGSNICFTDKYENGCLGVSNVSDASIINPIKLNFPSPVEKIFFNSLDKKDSQGKIHRYNFVRLKDGSLWGWGRNISGQVGIGSNEKIIASPQKIELPSTVKQLIKYQDSYNYAPFEINESYIALLENGDLYSWGENIFNFGFSTINSKIPVKLNFPKKIIDLKYNNRYLYITFEDNSIYSNQPIFKKITKDGYFINDMDELFIIPPKYSTSPDLYKINIPGIIIDVYNGKIYPYATGFALTEDNKIYYFNYDFSNKNSVNKLVLELNPKILKSQIIKK